MLGNFVSTVANFLRHLHSTALVGESQQVVCVTDTRHIFVAGSCAIDFEHISKYFSGKEHVGGLAYLAMSRPELGDTIALQLILR